MSSNTEVQLTLDDAVEEILGGLTGLDLSYEPQLDRYRAVTRQVNRAMRQVALAQEWGWYSSVLSLGAAAEGEREILLPTNKRPRIVNDDAVRLVDSEGQAVKWAYFLPRDALHKYSRRRGLWCAHTRRSLLFSRAFHAGEAGYDVQVSVMREPEMFRLPDPGETVPLSTRGQLIDFAYPDLVVYLAMFLYAQSDPVMQPRAQALEDQYKTLLYALIERDVANTDTPYSNDFRLGIQNGLRGESMTGEVTAPHPHSDYV